MHSFQKSVCLVLLCVVSLNASAFSVLFPQCSTFNSTVRASWPPSSQPVPYFINFSTFSDIPTNIASNAIQQAFETWSSPACGVWDSSYQGETNETNPASASHNIIFIEDEWPSMFGSVNTTIALTGNTVTGCNFIDSDILINGVGFTFTNGLPSMARQVDLQSIMTHEAGHFLGLGHSSAPDATMKPSYSGELLERTLTGDDEAGVCALYPHEQDRSLNQTTYTSSAGPSASSNFILEGTSLGESSALGTSQSTEYHLRGGFLFNSSVQDPDNDSIPNHLDNCPSIANFDQLDTDNDKQGDACDIDDDNDGTDDDFDNCPLVSNHLQTNTDGDLQGDACDDDDDNDSVEDRLDNCQFESNENQEDNDRDGFGDICDTDDDEDGVLDEDDNCPLIANPEQNDSNGNSIGDECESEDDELCIPIRTKNGAVAVICL